MLNELIYDHYLNSDSNKKAKEFNPEDILYFNPSSFSACRKQIYLKKRNVKPSDPIDTVALLKMRFGTVLHTEIENIVKKLGILIESEKLKTAVFNGLNFRYKTDGKIVLNKQRTIMEIKTTSSGALRVVRDEAKGTDVVQMVLYMIFENIANGVLLYVGRDSALIEEYAVAKGDHLYLAAIAEIERKIQELKRLEVQIKTGVIPERDCQIVMKNTNGFVSEKFQKDKVIHKSDFQCSYCQWKSLCWRSELEEIKNHKFFIENEFID